MKIKNNKRNELFNRQELIIEIESEKNPGYAEVKKIISKEIGKPEENIEVLRVKGKFGRNVFNSEVYVYDSKGDLDKMGALRRTKKQRVELAKAVKEIPEKKD